MTERLVADAIVDRLKEWGVARLFGYAGDGINGVLGALRRSGAIEFVQARHEETAAFMAVGHAKYTGEVGIVLSTQGPGAVHLLNGLYDAKLDSAPVVAIVGQQSRTVLGSAYMQEIDLQTLFGDVAAYVQTVMSAEQVPLVVDQAIRTAYAMRSPCVVIVPHDVQNLPAAEPLAQEHGNVPSAAEWRAPRVLPQPDDLQRAADVLLAGERVAVFVGQGVRDAHAEVVAIAERLGAGITTSLLGKPYVDESLPFATGTMGHLGTSASGHLLAHCDTLLLVGTNDPWTEFYPPPGQARAVQIDFDGARIGNRYPIEVGLVGDAAETLRALLELLPERTFGPWRGVVEEQVRTWHALAAERAALPADPVNPELAIRALSGKLPADAQVSIDVGSVVYWYARHVRLPAGVPAHLSSTLASMGSALPYGLAAKLAHPDRPLVALAGDGAMQMNGIAELVTVAHRWRSWTDPRFVVCVLNNRDLAEVTWEQREMESEPRYVDSQELPDFPYAAYAELLGLRGIRVDDPAAVDAAWDDALSADRPCVIEMMVDRDVPLLPPYPAGDAKLDSFREGLEQEGEAGRHGRALLDAQAEQEHRLLPDA